MTDQVIEATHEFQLKILNDELDKLKHENIKLKLLLNEAGIETDTSAISDSEAICIINIQRLKDISQERNLSKDETDIFDKLHKNLKICQGGETRVKKKDTTKEMSSEELAKMLKDV